MSQAERKPKCDDLSRQTSQLPCVQPFVCCLHVFREQGRGETD
jgi:hypothetical protein